MPTSLPSEIEQTVRRDGVIRTGAGRADGAPEETRDATRPPAASPAATAARAPDAWKSGRGNGAPTVTPPPGGNLLPLVPGYVVAGEIARGGMGVVLAARDVALGREVAIKTLLPSTTTDSVAARRFVTEARITARLSHPGVPPVHALDTLPDGRPFLVMKLIKGRTLAAVLTARGQRPSSRATEDMELTALHAPGLLQVFEQICQAVGFAHAQGVIHRDLKPANVMVGAFGEVQVMDWGLAREIGRTANEHGRPHPAPTPNEPGREADTAVRASDDTEQSRLGEALGTPGFMPPEQARGEWDRVDARADVFALGGILCVILTGKPPYTGRTALEVVRRAMAADLGEALARLDSCGADPDLVALAKRCLAPDPEHRLLDAATVAAVLQAHRLHAEERVRAVETARAASAINAEEDRARAAALAAARRAAEERVREATRRAEADKAHASQRHWALTAVIVLLVIVLMGLYQDYRDWGGRTVPDQQVPTAAHPEHEKPSNVLTTRTSDPR